MAWPSLTRRPISETKELVPDVIKHSTESGHRPRRPRNSRKIYRYMLAFDLMIAADAEALIAHFDSVETWGSFAWVDINSVSHDVIFDKAISYVEQYPGWYKFNTINLVEI